MSEGRRVVVRRSRSEWQGIMSRFEGSGLSLKRFCVAEDLAPSTFALWRRRLSRAGPSGGGRTKRRWSWSWRVGRRRLSGMRNWISAAGWCCGCGVRGHAEPGRGPHRRAVVLVRQPPAHDAEDFGVRCRGLLDLVEAVEAGPVRGARARRGRAATVELHGVAGADRGGRHRGETAANAVSKGGMRGAVLVNFRPSKRRIKALCRVPGSRSFNKRMRG